MFNNRYRYFILTMIVFITIVNYVDRGALSYAAEPIMKEFGLNTEQWGQILGFFGYGYMFGALLGGSLADRKGPKFMWILAAVSWSIFEILTAFSGEIGLAIFGGSAVAEMAMFRILFGFAEGPAVATANRTIANWTSNKERGFASSIMLLGVPIGALITAPVAVSLLTVFGWKAMFIILGAIGLVWATIWVKVFTNTPAENSRVSKEEVKFIEENGGLASKEVTEKMQKVPWYHFFKNPNLIMNSLGYFCFMYINFVLLTWTPKYIQDVFGFSLSSLWYLGMIPWIGACFTVLIGGKISDKLLAKTGSYKIARSGLVIVSYACTAVCFLIIPFVSSPYMVLALMCIGNAFNYLPNSVHWAVVTDTEPTKAGTFGGITHFIANIAAVMAPTLTGFLVASKGYEAMFIAATIAAVAGSIVMSFCRPGPRNKEKEVVTEEQVSALG